MVDKVPNRPVHPIRSIPQQYSVAVEAEQHVGFILRPKSFKYFFGAFWVYDRIAIGLHYQSRCVNLP